MIGSEERAAVMRVMERGVLSGYKGNWSEAFYGGEEVRALEAEWATYFSVKHAICCNSATSGLWMALAAIGLQNKKGEIVVNKDGFRFKGMSEEIIVSPYSMTCSASMPLHFGAWPVFADIEPDYYCLDPASVEAAITPRTKAIIVVDLFGQPYDADAINAIAKKHGIYVIKDAAQAIGAKYKGKYAGTLGDIGVYSLNVHKHIQCGEGGVVVTDNDELAFKLRLAMNHSEAVCNDMFAQLNGQSEMLLQDMPYRLNNRHVSLVGMNLRMTELSAAIAREQLKKLDGIIQVVREQAKRFNVKVRPGCEHAYYRYAMPKEIWQDYPEEYHYMFNWKEHYIKPLYQMPLFAQLGYDQRQCPVCEAVDENIILAWLKETP